MTFMYRRYRQEHTAETNIMSETGGCEKQAADLIKASLTCGDEKNVPNIFVVLGASVSRSMSCHSFLLM